MDWEAVRPKLNINDQNWHQYAPGAGGYVDWGGHRRFCSAKWGKPNSTLPQLPQSFKLIPKEEVASRAKDLWQAEATLVHRFRKMNGDKSCTKDQDGLSYCHAFCTTSMTELARELQGEKYVELSPSFVGNIITGFTNSGAYIEDDMQCVIDYGISSVEFVPECSISRDWYNKNREATMANAALHKLTGWTALGSSRDEYMAAKVWTCLLQGIPVVKAHNWWSHAISGLFIDGDFKWWDLNSWGHDYGDDGVFTQDLSKGTADAAWVPTACIASLL